jgi:hypothetical protein
MKNLIILFLLIPTLCVSQLPSYPIVLESFFSSYSFHADDPVLALNFAKKKDGWYVQVINRITEKVQEEQLFWSLNDSSFHVINGMQGGLPKEESEKETEQFINGASLYNFYGYERCQYYGYDTWAVDMIRDFGGGDPRKYSDTLLEGLARAYSAHSGHFLWYQQGGYQNQDASLQKKLLPLEKPSPRRIDSVVININKAVGIFRLLAERNPRYKTVIGNSGMKVFNELMNGYMQMMMTGYEEKAQLFIRAILPNRSITQLAKNYLAGCPPHAILFTFGDNDTYPLWYVQEHEQFRKDVTVLNTNLLGFAPYVDMIRRKGLVRFRTGPEYYGDSAFIYFTAKEGNNNSVLDAENFLEILLEKKFPRSQGDQFFSLYPSKNITINVDRDKFSSMSHQPGLKRSMQLQLGDYFTSDQFLTLDIILTNLYSRPILFTGNPHLYQNYLQKEGLNFRLLPLSAERKHENDKISRTITEKILHAFIRAVPSNDTKTGIAPDNGMDANIYDIFITLLTNSTSKEYSHSLVSKLLLEYHNNLSYAPNLSQLSVLMIGAGYADEGIRAAETYANQIYQDYRHPRAAGGFISKSAAEKFISQLNDSLKGLNVKNDVLDDLLNRIKQD